MVEQKEMLSADTGDDGRVHIPLSLARRLRGAEPTEEGGREGGKGYF